MTVQDPGTRSFEPPEPDLTPDELVARATALRGALRERQDECDGLGPAPGLDAARLHRRGVLAHGAAAALRRLRVRPRHVPAHHDGAVTRLPVQRLGVRAHGRAQPHRRELRGAGPDRAVRRRGLPLPALRAPRPGRARRRRLPRVRLVGLLRPAATSRPTSSAARSSPSRRGEIDTRWVCFRRDQFEIIDNWDTLGMRGTGSRRVVVQDLFVPEHHTVPSPNPFRPVVELPGRDVHANPMFRGPLASLLISEPAAVCVGIAHAAVDAYIEMLTTKHQWGPMSPLRSEVGVFQRLLGEATALPRHRRGRAAPGRTDLDGPRRAGGGDRRRGHRRGRPPAHPRRAADHRSRRRRSSTSSSARAARAPRTAVSGSSATSATSTWSGPTSRSSRSGRGRTSGASGSG